MNSSSTQQTVQTAANILSDEKTWVEIRFAVTGCADADLIAGMHALFDHFLPRLGSNRYRQRIFELLVAVHKDSADREEKQSVSLGQYTTGPSLQGQNPQLFGMTSAGGLGSVASSISNQDALDRLNSQMMQEDPMAKMLKGIDALRENKP